jgi:hypothetical protein
VSEKERDSLATTDDHKSTSTMLKKAAVFSSEITRNTYRIISEARATNQSVNSRGTWEMTKDACLLEQLVDGLVGVGMEHRAGSLAAHAVNFI